MDLSIWIFFAQFLIEQRIFTFQQDSKRAFRKAYHIDEPNVDVWHDERQNGWRHAKWNGRWNDATSHESWNDVPRDGCARGIESLSFPEIICFAGSFLFQCFTLETKQIIQTSQTITTI